MAASSTLMQWAPPMECQDEFNKLLTESYELNQLRSFSGIFIIDVENDRILWW